MTERKRKRPRRVVPKPAQSESSEVVPPIATGWFRRHKDEIFISIMGSVGSAILIGVLFGFPRFILENWQYVRGYWALHFNDGIIASVQRSLVNNQFIVMEGPDGRPAAIRPTGTNFSYQLHVLLTNYHDESIEISSMATIGRDQNIQLSNEYHPSTLKPRKPVLYHIPEVSINNDFDLKIIEALLSGRIDLVLKTNFGSVSIPIDCVCFAGQIVPENKPLYWVGTDSSCFKFEMEDPDGLNARTSGFTRF